MADSRDRAELLRYDSQRMAAHATICTWNIKTPGGKSASDSPLSSARVDLIRETLESKQPVVMALQEVTPGYARSLVALGLHHSLTFRAPGEFDGGNRMLGVGLLTSGNVQVRNVGIVERAPFPDRTLAADLEVDGVAIHVLAFHSLTGVGFRAAKHAQFRALAEHLAGRTGHTLFLGDANEPRIDARDPEHIACWHRNGDKGAGAALLFGPKPVHGLVDAWRKLLSAESLAALPVDGPLATSHVANGRPCRYDCIYVPPAWRVVEMLHDMKRATDAGSDHALVTARVEIC